MEAHNGRVTPAEPKPKAAPTADEPTVAPNELAQLAAQLRRAVASIDTEARERLESAWVALTSAIKQPQHDAGRITARLARLRGEIDRVIAGQRQLGKERSATPGEANPDGD